MKQILFLFACIWSCATFAVRSQPSESLQPSRYVFQLARILTKDGILRSGWLLGTLGDTLVAQIGGKSERISRRDLLRVDIEAPQQKGKSTLVGMFAGIYAGNALALRAENQPFLFMRENNQGEVALYSALFALLGAGVGFLAGAAGDYSITFDFSGDEAANASTWEDLVEGGSGAGHKRLFHFSLQGAWVSGPLPKPGTEQSQFYYSYDFSGATRLNMVRKVQLTYSLTKFMDAGLATVWLGQPSIAHYSPSYGGGVTVSLEGSGLYVIGVFQPLWKLGWRVAQWDIGAGFGRASYDFRASSPPFYVAYDSVSPGTFIEKKKTAFSTLLYTEFKVFLTDYFSLGITADWAYIPEKVPDVQGFTFDSHHLGSTSIGFVLSFHL